MSVPKIVSQDEWTAARKAFLAQEQAATKQRDLLIYHFMFHPEWEDGCPSCTAGTDELSPRFLEHLNTRDTSYAMVSRAPLAKLERWKAQRGWDIPWYSSGDGDFNYDFGVTIDASRGFDEFNFRTLDEYASIGHESMKTSDQPYTGLRVMTG